MSLIKGLGFIAVVASAAVVVTKQIEKEKRNKELDSFLLYDETEPIVVDVEEDISLEADIASLLEKDERAVTFVFSLTNREAAIEFQELLSQHGLSSNLDTQNTKVEILYNEDMNQENLNSLLNDFESVLEIINAKYEGYRTR